MGMRHKNVSCLIPTSCGSSQQLDEADVEPQGNGGQHQYQEAGGAGCSGEDNSQYCGQISHTADVTQVTLRCRIHYGSFLLEPAARADGVVHVDDCPHGHWDHADDENGNTECSGRVVVLDVEEHNRKPRQQNECQKNRNPLPCLACHSKPP